VLYLLQQQWAFPDVKLMQGLWLTVAVSSGILTYFVSAQVLGERLCKTGGSHA